MHSVDNVKLRRLIVLPLTTKCPVVSGLSVNDGQSSDSSINLEHRCCNYNRTHIGVFSWCGAVVLLIGWLFWKIAEKLINWCSKVTFVDGRDWTRHLNFRRGHRSKSALNSGQCRGGSKRLVWGQRMECEEWNTVPLPLGERLGEEARPRVKWIFRLKRRILVLKLWNITKSGGQFALAFPTPNYGGTHRPCPLVIYDDRRADPPCLKLWTRHCADGVHVHTSTYIETSYFQWAGLHYVSIVWRTIVL